MPREAQAESAGARMTDKLEAGQVRQQVRLGSVVRVRVLAVPSIITRWRNLAARGMPAAALVEVVSVPGLPRGSIYTMTTASLEGMEVEHRWEDAP